MNERRRAGRINARLWTLVRGVDTEHQKRRCNVSVTGVFVEIDREVGEPGSVQEIQLMTLDRGHKLELMARVVRVFSISDIWRGTTVAGLAFDFMLATPQVSAAVEDFLRALYDARPRERLPAVTDDGVQFSYAGDVPGTGKVTVENLSGGGMTLTARWPAAVGESIRCEITAPSSQQTFVLEGDVTHSTPGDELEGAPSHRVQVRFRPTTAAATTVQAAGLSIGDAIDALLEEAVFAAKETGFSIPNEHLRGQLSRIRLGSLLGFFEMERLTGVLRLSQESGAAGTVYLQQGRVTDCEVGSGEPLAALSLLLAWQSGTFEFALGEVQRPDRIHLSTSHLLLRLATESDEQGRDEVP